jgi:DDE superfamily endonuclease
MNNTLLYRLPSYTSYKLQPYNIGVFAPLKTVYRDEVKQLYREGLNTVNKKYFTSLYKPIKERLLIKKNIIIR